MRNWLGGTSIGRCKAFAAPRSSVATACGDDRPGIADAAAAGTTWQSSSVVVPEHYNVIDSFGAIAYNTATLAHGTHLSFGFLPAASATAQARDALTGIGARAERGWRARGEFLGCVPVQRPGHEPGEVPAAVLREAEALHGALPVASPIQVEQPQGQQGEGDDGDQHSGSLDPSARHQTGETHEGQRH